MSAAPEPGQGPALDSAPGMGARREALSGPASKGMGSCPRVSILFVPAGLLVLFLGLALPRTAQIPGHDEIAHYLGLGQRLFEHGYRQPDELIVFSPHLYGLAIWVSHLLFGPGLVAARLPGLLAWSLTLCLVGGWLRQVFGGASGAVTAVALALLAVTPLAVQAAAIVDIDNTILVPAILALVFAVSRYVDCPDRRRAALVVGAMAVALWCRLTTPTILIPVLLLYSAWRAPGLRTVVRVAVVLGLGWALFLASWGLYCRLTGVHFTGPFYYLVDAFVFCAVSEQRGIRPGKIALTLGYLLLWTGPWLAGLWATLGWERLRRLWQDRKPEAGDVFLLTGSAILAGYCLMGGTIFGFPKYHCPALPLLLLAAALNFRDTLIPPGRRGWLAFGALALLAAGLQVALLGDPLHVLRLDLRELVFRGQSPVTLVLTQVVAPLLLSLALPLPLVFALRRLHLVSWPCAVAALALGANLAFVVVQQAAGYQTGYNYGDRGDARALALALESCLSERGTAIVPGEIVYLLQRPGVRAVTNELWSDERALAQALQQPEVEAAGASLLTNTMNQVQTLIRVASASPGFQRADVGRYVVFVRTAAP